MARRRVPLGSLRSTAPPSKPPSNWRTRIGCKRSAPNAPPLKKKKPYREVAADSDVSKTHEGNWSLSGQCGTGQALRCDSCEHSFSPKGEDVNCQNSCSTEHHVSDRGASHLHNMHPLDDISVHNFSPKGEDVNRQNSCSTEHHLSARGASHLHMHRQRGTPEHETPESNCSAIGGDLHLPDSRPKFVTAEELNEDEEASDAESQVDRWACCICKVAAVSIVVLPCRHLCLCWDCEEKTEDCPVCGQAKRDVFYINCYT